jgi:hypothetical protein
MPVRSFEGNIRKTGDRPRITAQLVNVADGYHLWSETYERPTRDVFAIQARNLARHRQRSAGPGREQPVKRDTENVEAYDFYPGALHESIGNPDAVPGAMNYFHQAMAWDACYARTLS